MLQKEESVATRSLCPQMQCKLYVFEKTAQSWKERGRGLLRLNDMASTDDGMLQSRLGKRTSPTMSILTLCTAEPSLIQGPLSWIMLSFSWFSSFPLCFILDGSGQVLEIY